MRTLILSCLFALAACGQQAPPLPPEPAAEEAAPAPQAPAAINAPQVPLATGILSGMSQTAMAIPGLGAVRIEPTLIQYTEPPVEADGPITNTVAVQTQMVQVYTPGTLIAAGGESFATASAGNFMRAEVRKITGTPPAQLCGQTPATYVALMSSDPLTGLTLIYFSGPDAPSPTAQHSAVCATYSYAVD